jgi:hypothetical protein
MAGGVTMVQSASAAPFAEFAAADTRHHQSAKKCGHFRAFGYAATQGHFDRPRFRP